MQTIIDGHTVEHDNSVSRGIYYLTHELDELERRVYFHEAYDHGSAVFEDHMGYKYKLSLHGSEYQLTKV